MKRNYQFVILDDDRVNNMICQKIILNTFPDAEVHVLAKPEDAIAWFQKKIYRVEDLVLFLDLNMPQMSGWQFLNYIQENFTDVAQASLIHLLTSSIDFSDIEKAKNYPFVRSYVVKPLSSDFLKANFSK
jgi:CheY-like chemotaxis protein